MYAGGEIRDLAAIGLPSIGIVTAVQPVHLSRLGTIEAIEDAKAELVEALPPAADGGVAILNADDARVARMASRTRARVTTYGFDAGADVRATAVESAGFEGMRFRLVTPAGEARRHDPVASAGSPCTTRSPRRPRGWPPGCRSDAILPGLAAPSHRRAPLDASIRAGGVTIVDDAYNASPGSMRAALELLGGLPGRHLAVLGEMRELGDGPRRGPPRGRRGRGGAGPAGRRRRRAGRRGRGDRRTRRARRAGDGSCPSPTPTPPSRSWPARLRPGDVVLVKASRGVELERVVDGLVAALGGRRRDER